ncbi:helix-turn-helix transcriptional regulator [Kamptonema sp. UHCC 0994]|uniref:helix-turn-helix domain-containing protein n=1 Tax=Kamptonema sp. UHCC 0994 TaxID=3031329 RepID=UPI0023B98BFE|nr:helix-turn-helix transcriptional regulator [Kamptonema sp. UHCC 0994]MDF0551717.1 helix-turn-helix transcriptional regulator [Kamptonema sp. UHCC 0994]
MNPETVDNPEPTPTLKNLVEAAGKTQRQLSKDTGIPEVTINTWVARKTVPRLDNAIVVCRELNISLKVFAKSMGLNVEGLPDDQPPRRTGNSPPGE